VQTSGYKWIALIKSSAASCLVFGVVSIVKVFSPTPTLLRRQVLRMIVASSFKRVLKRSRDALFMLAKASRYNDPDAGLHLWRMAAFARELAATVGWSQADCELLELAALLHDTGRIAAAALATSGQGS
jgi:putative two-component system response regulator